MTSDAQPLSATVTRRFAEFALRSAASVPEGALRAARRTIANSIGLSVGAATHLACLRARSVMSGFDTPPQASVFGTDERMSMTVAALLNGIGAHVEDFDDTHLRTVIHPGAPIVPAALAVAEHTAAAADDVVAAVAIGIEVALRIGNGICPAHFDRGWHLTSSVGRFGAVIAAGRLLGHDADTLAAGLAIAATEVAGLQEALGTMTKSFHPGKAAHDGIEAALLASFGVTGPQEPISGPWGFAMTTSPEQDFAAMFDELGQVWEVEENAFKPYSCGIVSHPIIDAAIGMRPGLAPDDIDRVIVRTNPVVLDVMGVEEPTTGLQSKFSAYHCFAIGLIYGGGGPEQFSDAVAVDPVVSHLRSLVTIELDAAIAADECFASVRTRDGRVFEHHVEHATASVAAPMTDAQLVDKVRLVAAGVIGEERATELAKAALVLGSGVEVGDLVALATPVRPSAGHGA